MLLLFLKVICLPKHNHKMSFFFSFSFYSKVVHNAKFQDILVVKSIKNKGTVTVFLYNQKINRFKMVLMTSFTNATESKLFLLPQYFLAILLTPNSQKTPFGETSWLTGCHAMPCHWSFLFLLSPCYLQNAIPCQWSSRDLPRVLRIWERASFTLRRFLPYTSSC